MDDNQCAYRPKGVKCENRTNGYPVRSLKKRFEDHGKAILVFENCNDKGSVQILLNSSPVRKIISFWASGKMISIAQFVYKPNDVLEVNEVDEAIIKISSLTSARRKYFLSIRAINLIE